MNVKLLALIACLVVPFQWVSADIAADFKAELTTEKVLANAMAGGMSIKDAVSEMVTLKPKRVVLIIAAALKVSPQDAGVIVVAATSIKCSNAVTSVLKTQCENTIMNAAIFAGADPTLITAATAASSTSRAITATALAPASGGAGGGVASPN
ncbi:MAG: hypothetical protein KAT06_08855 [Gammaproteobacteria bacterium]|nr:hypothetical protein [Gammaproteobacteria bacterium]